ncbi:YibE/F family protein, partial [Rhizobium leguminosarum]|nr:YibE/F family protein [Rhizobium ruizarguesonis]
VDTSQLCGLGNEDNLLIHLYLPEVSVPGLLMAGFIIGALGVLNDVTIAQSSTVHELFLASPESSARSTFAAALRVGRDHIASMVYTLVLAYLGTALPLAMLLSVSDRPLMQALSSDVVATELIRSAIGAISLVLAVPITTFIAAHTVRARKPQL